MEGVPYREIRYYRTEYHKIEQVLRSLNALIYDALTTPYGNKQNHGETQTVRPADKDDWDGRGVFP